MSDVCGGVEGSAAVVEKLVKLFVLETQNTDEVAGEPQKSSGPSYWKEEAELRGAGAVEAEVS